MRQFEFDVDVLDDDRLEVENATICIRNALLNTRPIDIPNTTGLIVELLGAMADVNFTLLNNTANITDENPCGDSWCTNFAPEDEPEPEKPFPWWIIVIAVGAIALIVAGVLLARKWKNDNAMVNRRGLLERPLEKMEQLWVEQELDEQALPLTALHLPADRAGSNVVKRKGFKQIESNEV